MDENQEVVANQEPAYEADYSEPQQPEYEGTPEPAETTSSGAPSTYAIRIDNRTGRKSIVYVGADEENAPEEQGYEEPDYNYQQDDSQYQAPQPQPQQQNQVKYQNAGEILQAIENNTLDESRIPVEMVFQYAQFKAAQQAQIAEQTPEPEVNEEQIKAKQEYFTRVETLARTRALEDADISEDDLVVAQYSDDPDLQMKAAIYETALNMHRNEIVQAVQQERARQIQEEAAQKQVINNFNNEIDQIGAKEPHFKEIADLMTTFYKDPSIGFDNGCKYMAALQAYSSGNITAQQAKDLKEYYGLTRKALYSRMNGIGSYPRRSPYVESYGNNAPNVNTDRAELLKRLRTSTDYREKRHIIGLLTAKKQ